MNSFSNLANPENPYQTTHIPCDPFQNLQQPVYSTTFHQEFPAINCSENFLYSPQKFFASADAEKRYREKRSRNNQAAQKSRKVRKEREKQAVYRVTILEQENQSLKLQLDQVKQQLHYATQRLIQINAPLNNSL
ncbi:unnamed protein product, partial [Mesorhabditis belari]|uniref:BZIP domain-containing protein n=1 Tax=Mesorhabditis belari TaxID=2138241 RepID=A0AAF3E861_9BILA